MQFHELTCETLEREGTNISDLVTSPTSGQSKSGEEFFFEFQLTGPLGVGVTWSDYPPLGRVNKRFLLYCRVSNSPQVGRAVWPTALMKYEKCQSTNKHFKAFKADSSVWKWGNGKKCISCRML